MIPATYEERIRQDAKEEIEELLNELVRATNCLHGRFVFPSEKDWKRYFFVVGELRQKVRDL